MTKFEIGDYIGHIKDEELYYVQDITNKGYILTIEDDSFLLPFEDAKFFMFLRSAYGKVYA